MLPSQRKSRVVGAGQRVNGMLLLTILLAIMGMSDAQFNIFKNYNDSPVKPPQYALKNTEHAIDEYLAPDQKMMKANRHGPITKMNAMGKKWSGFDEWKRVDKLKNPVQATATSDTTAAATGITTTTTVSNNTPKKALRSTTIASPSTSTASDAAPASDQMASQKKQLRTRSAPLTSNSAGVSS